MPTLDPQTQQPAPAEPPRLSVPPARRSRQLLTSLSVVAALALLVTCALLALNASRQQQNGSTGGAPSSAAGHINLNSISMISPDEGWAVGNQPRSKPDTNPVTGAVDQNAVEPIILHYKDGRWSQDQLPPDMNPYNLDMSLGSISMVSATEGWASGSTLLPRYHNTVVDGITFPVLLHYTGGKWTLVDYPSAAFGYLSIRSTNDGWALGASRYPDTYGNLALRYNDQTWTEIKAPAFASFSPDALAEAPDGEVWVTGTDYSKPGFDGDAPAAIVHYDGSAWTRTPINLANDGLLGLAMVSASEGWAVGYDPGGTRRHHIGPQQGLIVQYRNGVWEKQSVIAGPAADTDFYLAAVAMVSTDEGWAVGQDGVIVHDHNGAWARAQSPTDQALHSVVMVSPDEGWAVGDQGTMLHYVNGVWSIYRG